jgi:hypothetical protein
VNLVVISEWSLNIGESRKSGEEKDRELPFGIGKDAYLRIRFI